MGFLVYELNCQCNFDAIGPFEMFPYYDWLTGPFKK
jgi:hypothetical protein